MDDDKSMQIPCTIRAIPHILLCSLLCSLCSLQQLFAWHRFWRVEGDFPLVSLSFFKLKIHLPIGKSFHSIVVVRSLRKRKVASSILAGSSGVKGRTNSYPGLVI